MLEREDDNSDLRPSGLSTKALQGTRIKQPDGSYHKTGQLNWHILDQQLGLSRYEYSIRQKRAGDSRIQKDTAGYGRIQQDTAGYGRIRRIWQDMAVHGRIRQIQQHTAVYGMMPQDAAG